MFTFHNILAGCEAGDADAWRAFVSDYTPIMQRLAAVYLHGANDEPWRLTLRAVSEDNFSALRTFEHQSEREFLMGLRNFYLQRSAGALDPADDDSRIPAPTAETTAALLKGVPLVHQEVLFLKLAGYSNATLEKIFRITPAVAQNSLERLKDEYRAALDNQTDRGLRPAAWLKLMGQLHGAKTEACPPLRQFVRIQDGQAGWSEKEPAETHMANCLHCLERWTALREIAYWRRTVEPTPVATVETLIHALPVHQVPAKPKPLFKRLFG